MKVFPSFVVRQNAHEVHEKSSIVSSSVVLNISFMSVAIGGALFWAIAARISSSESLGQVAALSSSINFVVLLTAGTLVPFVVRYGSGTTRAERALHNRVLLFASFAAGTEALLLAFIFSATNSETFRLIESLKGSIMFAMVAMGSVLVVLHEARFLSQKRYRWIVGRSILTAVFSVGLVATYRRGSSPLALFIATSGVPALAGLFIWLASDFRDIHKFAMRPLPDVRGEIVRYLSVTWTGSLLGRSAMAFFPLFVAIKVGPAEYAKFFIAWNIAVIMFLVVQSPSMALLADSGRRSPFKKQTRHALLSGIAISAVMIVTSGVSTPLVHRVFGEAYIDSVKVLRVFILCTVFMAIYAVANAVMQVRYLSFGILGLPLLQIAGIYIPLVFTPHLTMVKAAVALLAGVTIAGSCGAIAMIALRERSFTPFLPPPITSTEEQCIT
jgi:O-antigen/teichoic acid export membrane protein